MPPDHTTNQTPPEPDPATLQPIGPRYKLTIAYDGTLFHGWQKQHPPGLEPLRTVAGVVEAAIARTVQQPVTLVGASRTDAGVHALGQVAQFNAATRIPINRLADAINSRLPDDVVILDCTQAHPDFDAISHARSKQYRYRIFNSNLRPLHLRHHVYPCWKTLDLPAMSAAATQLVGTHDFAAFAAAGHNRLTTVRTIYSCTVEAAATLQLNTREVHIVVTGSGFLYNMVRIIAGTLLNVGIGKIQPTQITAILASCNRASAGPTLPAQALWLEWIKHDHPASSQSLNSPQSPPPGDPNHV